MNFNKHYNLEGRHAFLSPSSYAWIRYDVEKLAERWVTSVAAKRGTELHDLAQRLITLGVKLPKTKTTLNMYVNDVIGHRMTPEQVLYYSENCFGTADAIGLKTGGDRILLRIFDLKTGITKASVDQLLVYAALFCHEYGFTPFELDYDLRIYQNDDKMEFEVDPGDIVHIMEQIKLFDKKIKEMQSIEEV